jgi:2-dehydro-3-deoxyphosphooctonate aldolase (KDO 8-P synthase)
MAQICDEAEIRFVFKASFDKANRTHVDAFRGPGLDEGLEILAEVRSEVGVPVTTDIHEPWQADRVAGVVDLIQIPAFLCRQTDLIRAAAETNKPINLKKGQFMSPEAMGHAVVKASGGAGVMVTERGTFFGYGDLVVDMRAIRIMGDLGVPVIFDATHSVQRPASGADRTGGSRQDVPGLSCAAVAAGVDAIFAEVHDEPKRALSDAATQLPLRDLPSLLARWAAISKVVRP